MNMKRIVSVLVVIILISTSTLAVFAREKQSVSEIESIYEEYKDDEQFKFMRSEYGEAYADKFIKDVYNSRIQSNILPLGGGGNECYQYVTNIKQTKTYNCGSTSVLQSLYALNSQGNVAGAGNAEKIETIDKKYNVDAQGHLMVYQVVDALNTYGSNHAPYVYVVGSTINEATFENYVATTLTTCKPVILHAKTKYIGYYGGRDLGHYLSLDYVNRTTDIVRIADCNYNDAYYGIHYISLSEAFNSIHTETGRYLIY